ncbi:hypothetical protein L873DRAFT_1811433 [Choiromyces venosus 120613-1]|uniref:Uncharacterized protein n=1 Tax=Choiromyces venosus 120613-1 TaxID=1336337 RepID=A0A3N4JH60_9PEZI|nr:hypothetical protein L873DRAFT_1811433 [Choiromyces venosus 120613-1]
MDFIFADLVFQHTSRVPTPFHFTLHELRRTAVSGAPPRVPTLSSKLRLCPPQLQLSANPDISNGTPRGARRHIPQVDRTYLRVFYRWKLAKHLLTTSGFQSQPGTFLSPITQRVGNCWFNTICRLL